MERVIELTKAQADILEPIVIQAQQAKASLEKALTLCGIDPADLTGMDLTVDPPILRVRAE